MIEICETCEHYEPLAPYEGICKINSTNEDISVVMWCGECLDWVKR